jgi:hypothetical protein
MILLSLSRSCKLWLSRRFFLLLGSVRLFRASEVPQSPVFRSDLGSFISTTGIRQRLLASHVGVKARFFIFSSRLIFCPLPRPCDGKDNMLLFPLCGCLHLKHPTDRSRCEKGWKYLRIRAHWSASDGRTDARHGQRSIFHAVTYVAPHTDPHRTARCSATPLRTLGERTFPSGWWVLTNPANCLSN